MATSNNQSSIEISGLAILAICFNEAIEAITVKVKENSLDWKKYPALFTRHYSFGIRMRDVQDQRGTKEKINFNSELKKFMRVHCDFYEHKKLHWLPNFFYSKVSENVVFGIGLETINHWGLGKAYTAWIIVEHVGGEYVGKVWRTNLFKFFGDSDSEPCWTYSTKDDLTFALESTVTLMRDITPILRKHLSLYFSNPLSGLPDSVLLRGAISARKAFKEALEMAKAWAKDAEVNRIGSACYLDIRDELGPAVNVEGKLKPHAYWSIWFCSATKQPELFNVHIPYAGTPYSRIDVVTNCDPYTIEKRFSHINDNWIDSDLVLQIAEDSGGRLARENSKDCFDIILGLERTRWSVRYLIVNLEGNRADFEIDIDA